MNQDCDLFNYVYWNSYWYVNICVVFVFSNAKVSVRFAGFGSLSNLGMSQMCC